MDDPDVPEALQEVIKQLTALATEQDLIAAAKRGCRGWFRNHAEEIPYQLSEVQLIFHRQALVFANSKLSYPYIETRLGMYVKGREIGHYRYIALLDGTADDDYFVLRPE